MGIQWMFPAVRRFTAAVVLLVLGACSSSPAGAPDPHESTVTVVVGATHVPSAMVTYTWKPKHPIAPIIMSDEEKAQRRLAYLDDDRTSWGLPPMDYPQLVRWIFPEEIASVMVPCLQDKGFTVFANVSGTGFNGPAPDPRNNAYGRAEVECSAMYTVDRRMLLGTPAQMSLLYEYGRDFLKPCVAAQGFSIDLPAESVWVTQHSGFDGYPSGNPVVEKACPYNPPGRYLVGEG